MKRIPVAVPDLGPKEESYVVDAMRSTWISSTGKYIDTFEREFAVACESTTCMGVCNGTVALHLALLALDVRPGDEVLVPALTYVATANAVRYVGGEPIFVDVDPQTWCMDPDKIEQSITRRTKGIIAVHLYGHPADMDRINQVAAVHGLWVVEDAAEAPFAKYHGRVVGSLSRIATFSFYGNKIVTCGEGGAVTVSDPQLAIRMRALRGQGVDPNRRYYFPITGYNFRITNVACAMLCAQLERRTELIARRREIFAGYRSALQDCPGIGFQETAPWAETAPWLFCITVDSKQYGHTRNELMDLLEQQNIESRPFFLGLHQLPPFREAAKRAGGELPVTERLSDSGMNLPTYTAMSNEDLDRVVGVIRKGRR